MEQRDEAFDATGLAIQPSSTVWERSEATNVPDNVETIVQTYSVAGSVLYLDSIALTGTFAAEFSVYLNSVKRETRRIEITDPSPTIPFHGIPLQVGDVLEVRVTHYDAGEMHDFESSVKGHR